jgi:hypothetical protein
MVAGQVSADHLYYTNYFFYVSEWVYVCILRVNECVRHSLYCKVGWMSECTA